MSDVVFETARLVVRRWSESVEDIDFLFDLYSRWEVQRFLGAKPKVMETREEAVAAAKRLAATAANPLFGSWAITRRDTSSLLGAVLLKPVPLTADAEPPPLSDDVEVGWHLHPAAWGHGYATEAAAGALQRGFDAGLAAVIALTYSANLPSQAVCKRLGMTHVGVTEKYYGVPCELFTRSPR